MLGSSSLVQLQRPLIFWISVLANQDNPLSWNIFSKHFMANFLLSQEALGNLQRWRRKSHSVNKHLVSWWLTAAEWQQWRCKSHAWSHTCLTFSQFNIQWSDSQI